MAQTQAAVKVGVVLVIALAMLFGLAYFFFGRTVGGYPVLATFGDAQGITEQAEVRLAGVKVGYVDEIDVDDSGRQAVLRLRIQPDARIPLGSTFSITSGGLLGEMYVQVTPPPRTADVRGYLPQEGPVPVVEGKDVPTFDELKEQVAQLGEGTQEVLENLKDVTENVARITENPALQQGLTATVRNAQIASAEGAVAARRISVTTARVSDTVADLNALIDQEVPTLRATLRNIEQTTQQGPPLGRNVNRLVATTNDLVRSLEETNVFLRQTLADTLEEAQPGAALRETLANLQRASAQFEAIAQSARKITEDLATTGDAQTRLGQAAESVSDVAERATVLLDRITGVTDRAGRRRGRLIPGAAQVGLHQTVDSDARFRANLQYALPRGPDSAIILGLYDLGESNKLILQNSVPASSRTRLRYGFYASKLALGGDYLISGTSAAPTVLSPAGATSLGANLYDPNDLQLDVYGRHQVNEKLGVLFGMTDVFDEVHPTIGLTYRP